MPQTERACDVIQDDRQNTAEMLRLPGRHLFGPWVIGFLSGF